FRASDLGFRLARSSTGGTGGPSSIAIEGPAAKTPSAPADKSKAWSRLVGRQRPDSIGPAPIACWTFESDARDEIGTMHGKLVGGALVREGQLYLDGTTGHMRTEPLSQDIREKTLEAWVLLGNLDQRGAGVISVESLKQDETYDAMALGEGSPRKW